MQQQVSALQLSREAQDRELARLRQEALQLAHSAAAAKAASEGTQQAGGGLREQADAAQAALSDQAMTIQQLQRWDRRHGGCCTCVGDACFTHCMSWCELVHESASALTLQHAPIICIICSTSPQARHSQALPPLPACVQRA
jgi:hypothetical protein